MFLWWSSTKMVKAIWIRQKTWPPGGRGLFSLYIYIEKIKTSSCQKPLDRFQYHFAEMFLWWSSTKIFQAIWIRQKTSPPGGRGLFSLYYLYRKLKNLLVRNHWTDFSIILQKCSFRDPLSRLFKPFGFVKTHGRLGRGFFSLYIYIENLKHLLGRNHWTDFHIILQKCSFGDPLPRLFKPLGFVKKHGRQGARLIFPIYLYRKHKKSSCQKPLDRFPYYFVEMFPWWPSTKIVQAIWICQKTWPPGGPGSFSLYIYTEKIKKSSCQKPQNLISI